jgi:5-(carboxyamino)imidazole ribonucleotide mutase
MSSDASSFAASDPPLVAVLMGSASDWDVMRHAVEVLRSFAIAHHVQVLSAHGMLASNTLLPVLGVPVPSRHLGGEDSLLSIVQMPRGIPVATFAIGEAGAANAALFAVAILATHDVQLSEQLSRFRAEQSASARNSVLPL